jgi:hypothetical protein
MKNMKLDKLAKDYILDCISTEGRELSVEPKTDKERLQFLFDTFRDEYLYEANIKRYGSKENCFKEWIMALPSSFNVDFENYKIILIAQKWGSLPEIFTDKQAEKIIENWFNFLSVKTFQLMKHNKVNIN